MTVKLLKCNGCGKMVLEVIGSKCPTKCCGEPMVELVPNTSDGAGEKHVPAVKVEGNKVTVQVGEVLHPMLEAHYINFVILETDKGYQKHDLKPGETPEAHFGVTEPVIAAYEYCNKDKSNRCTGITGRKKSND